MSSPSPEGNKTKLMIILRSLADRLESNGLDASEIRKLSIKVLESSEQSVSAALDYVIKRGLEFPRKQEYVDNFASRLSKMIAKIGL